MSEQRREFRLRAWPVLLGAAALVATCLIPPPSAFSREAWLVLGLTLCMGLWWATEALPLAVTSLMPLLVVPMIGLPDPEPVLTQYANGTIFLILGGFLLGFAMERCGLHRRIAYSIVARTGSTPRMLVLGVMIATAFMSMWVSNTSTTLMMLPVASSIAAIVDVTRVNEADARRFGAAIVLGVAYAATIGGMGTLIGTPTNALVQGFMQKNYGYDLSFVEWMSFGIPTVIVLLPLAWLLLTRATLRFDLPGSAVAPRVVHDAVAALGPWRRSERRVAIVAVLTAAAWVSRPWLNELPGLHGLTDTVIAIAAGLTLFLTPDGEGTGGALLDEQTFRRVPWDVMLLFGGGLALAAAIQASTLDQTFGEALQRFAHWPTLALTLVIVLLIVVWTEFNSNVATAATFMPILAMMTGGEPAAILMLLAPAAIASSAGFMLPVGTPPNAIVYGTGRVSFRQMLVSGACLDLIAVITITLVATVLLRV